MLRNSDWSISLLLRDPLWWACNLILTGHLVGNLGEVELRQWVDEELVLKSLKLLLIVILSSLGLAGTVLQVVVALCVLERMKSLLFCRPVHRVDRLHLIHRSLLSVFFWLWVKFARALPGCRGLCWRWKLIGVNLTSEVIDRLWRRLYHSLLYFDQLLKLWLIVQNLDIILLLSFCTKEKST